MKTHYDPWYVRLPDDRVMKAKSTDSVRHHVEAGNIPLNSMARRDTHDEWVSLVWINEFADLGDGNGNGRKPPPKRDMLSLPAMSLPEMDLDANSKPTVSARLDPMRLQTVGIRGLVDELIAAFDSTISSGKLLFACVSGMIGALVVFVAIEGTLAVYTRGTWLVEAIFGLVVGGVLAVVAAVLTRQSHLELSRMRPVSLRTAADAIGPFVLRVYLGYAATIGMGLGLMMVLQHIPYWLEKPLRTSSMGTLNAVLTIIWSVSVIIAVPVTLLMLLSFLLPPILVVEECSVGDALREWRSLIRQHRARVLIYEGMAIALALVASLPLAIAVRFALDHFQPMVMNWFSTLIPMVLYALAAGPALAFLAIANLFIYLNLRYEYTGTK